MNYFLAAAAINLLVSFRDTPSANKALNIISVETWGSQASSFAIRDWLVFIRSANFSWGIRLVLLLSRTALHNAKRSSTNCSSCDVSPRNSEAVPTLHPRASRRRRIARFIFLLRDDTVRDFYFSGIVLTVFCIPRWFQEVYGWSSYRKLPVSQSLRNRCDIRFAMNAVHPGSEVHDNSSQSLSEGGNVEDQEAPHFEVSLEKIPLLFLPLLKTVESGYLHIARLYVFLPLFLDAQRRNRDGRAEATTNSMSYMTYLVKLEFSLPFELSNI
jgi:hypothetical protein